MQNKAKEQLEARTRTCSEMEMETTLKNLQDFVTGSPVEYTLSREPEDTMDLGEQVHVLHEARIELIRGTLRVLNPEIDRETLDRVTIHTVIFVPASYIDPNIECPDWLKPDPYSNRITVIFDRRKLEFREF